MKIAILNTLIPFIYGGAEIHADSLKRKLIEYGHEAQVIRTPPFSYWPLDNIIDGIMAARLTRLINIDMMIGMKFPSYLIPHENKKIWLQHQFRQAYDFANTPYDPFTPDGHSQRIKQTIIETDNFYLKPLEGKIFTISQTTADRLKKYNSINATPLYPPIVNEELYYLGECGNYLFYPSRVNAAKRQKLLVEAIQYTKSNVKLVLAGKGDTPQDEEEILRLIEKYNVKEKVKYLNYFITEKEKVDLYANSLGVVFIPIDEDYGYITIEAFVSSKPVITCTDSGCPASFVHNGQCGYVVDSNVQELAAAMDRLFNDTKSATEMGQNAKLRLRELNINWNTVIERLLQ